MVSAGAFELSLSAIPQVTEHKHSQSKNSVFIAISPCCCWENGQRSATCGGELVTPGRTGVTGITRPSKAASLGGHYGRRRKDAAPLGLVLLHGGRPMPAEERPSHPAQHPPPGPHGCDAPHGPEQDDR